MSTIFGNKHPLVYLCCRVRKRETKRFSKFILLLKSTDYSNFRMVTMPMNSYWHWNCYGQACHLILWKNVSRKMQRKVVVSKYEYEYLPVTWEWYHAPAASVCRKSCSRRGARSRGVGRATATAAASTSVRCSSASSS